jgi:hypothetical protein
VRLKLLHLSAVVLAATFVAAPTDEARAGECALGRVIAERTLIKPASSTFYSVDALNPDITRTRDGRWQLFFSGNDQHTAAGNWRTGFATSASPFGPFRVDSVARADRLNGGTVRWRGRLWQMSTHNRRGGELAVSTSGRRWRRVAGSPALPDAYSFAADHYLQVISRRTLRLYALLRRRDHPLLGEIGVADYRSGHWTGMRSILKPGPRAWENTDLGEPAVVTLPDGRELMLYTATAGSGAARTIGLARRTADGSWARCGTRPVIGPGAPWARAIAIDPSVSVNRGILYVYYGGGSGYSIASDLRGAIGVRAYRLPEPRSASS